MLDGMKFDRKSGSRARQKSHELFIFSTYVLLLLI